MVNTYDALIPKYKSSTISLPIDHPLIPFFTDTIEQIKKLMCALENLRQVVFNIETANHDLIKNKEHLKALRDNIKREYTRQLYMDEYDRPAHKVGLTDEQGHPVDKNFKPLLETFTVLDCETLSFARDLPFPEQKKKNGVVSYDEDADLKGYLWHEMFDDHSNPRDIPHSSFFNLSEKVHDSIANFNAMLKTLRKREQLAHNTSQVDDQFALATSITQGWADILKKDKEFAEQEKKKRQDRRSPSRDQAGSSKKRNRTRKNPDEPLNKKEKKTAAFVFSKKKY